MVCGTYNYSYWGFFIPKFFIPLVRFVYFQIESDFYAKDMHLKVDRPKRRRKWSGATPHLGWSKENYGLVCPII